MNLDSILGNGDNIAVVRSAIAHLLFAWVIYRAAIMLYNVSPYHPLYAFPGPRLAAMTLLYEFWYDVVCFGSYTREIKRMHDVYGPIVRISPEELHCSDPDFADEIYAVSGRVRDKHQHFLNANPGPVAYSSFGTREHEVHRMRRGAINKFFSRAQMRLLEPEIHGLTQQLCDKLLAWTDRPLDLTMALSCYTSDTISNYAYGEPLGFLAQDGWDKNYKAALYAFLHTIYLFRYFAPLRHLVHIAPYVQGVMPADMANLFKELTETLPYHIRRATEGDAKTHGRIFADLLDSPLLPDSEKTILRLSAEGFSLTGAGTETTASTLTVIIYYLLAQPEIAERLKESLQGIDPHHLDWQTLEQIPYLYGVVYEGLRLSYGMSVRLPRIARTENLVYEKGKYHYVVPMGTPIGMSSPIVHHNEDFFPGSDEFRPERWIDREGGKNLPLEKYLFSFSKGSRQCVGMNLALCEIYLTMAAICLRVLPRMQLYETTEKDIKYDHDLMVPQPQRGSKGVRVLIR